MILCLGFLLFMRALLSLAVFFLWYPLSLFSPKDWKSSTFQCLSLIDETETKKVWVSMMIPRLKMSESQWWDQDWKYLSLNDKTKTKTEKSESQWRDRDQDWKNLSLSRDEAEFVNNETPSRLSLISGFPISGEENDLHAMKLILYDTGPWKIARLVGLEFFSPTGLTQPSQVWIWYCKKQTWSYKWIHFDRIYQIWLDSFCLASFLA